MLLIPDPKPLDRRLGKKFFRKAPRRPGVYLMKNEQDQVVYVGKAKDLKQRLGNYRNANPDRMPRRQLRMVNEVRRIEFQLCKTEAAALKHEKKLIRSLKPKFNRAGVWPGKPRFIVWRVAGEALTMSVVETPETGWQRFGPLNGGATYLQRALARLLWLAVNTDKPAGAMPTGWMRGDFMGMTTIECGAAIGATVEAVGNFFMGDAGEFVPWLGDRFSGRSGPFERQLIAAELETVSEFSANRRDNGKERKQLALL
jgi:predicted GIY-YIG superfamily endonuclease